MNRFHSALTALIIAVSMTMSAGEAAASEWAWVLSVPQARSEDSVYKVRILQIDGEAQKELLRYALNPGGHSITVEMMLDVQWEPDLSESGPDRAIKTMTLDLEAGKTYFVGARVDLDAPAESQLDQSFWQPEVIEIR